MDDQLQQQEAGEGNPLGDVPATTDGVLKLKVFAISSTFSHTEVNVFDMDLLETASNGHAVKQTSLLVDEAGNEVVIWSICQPPLLLGEFTYF